MRKECRDSKAASIPSERPVRVDTGERSNCAALSSRQPPFVKANNIETGFCKGAGPLGLSGRNEKPAITTGVRGRQGQGIEGANKPQNRSMSISWHPAASRTSTRIKDKDGEEACCDGDLALTSQPDIPGRLLIQCRGKAPTGMCRVDDDIRQFIPGFTTMSFAMSCADMPLGRKATSNAPNGMHQANIGRASLHGLSCLNGVLVVRNKQHLSNFFM